MTPEQSIADLARAFPRQAVERGTLAVYVRELQDVPAEVLALSVRDLIRTSEWFPTVRAIREQAAERMLDLPSETDALAQVGARIEWAREQSGDAPPVHPVVREALDLAGGFHRFRSADQASIVHAQFLKAYRERRGAAVRDAVTGTLAALPPPPSPVQLPPSIRA